ncbi:MAG TPA: hypothetical protein VKJ83_09480, partial [Actinomycetota bacterium]|nr:hypothetical protein [Actinomycetota bacterium]
DELFAKVKAGRSPSAGRAGQPQAEPEPAESDAGPGGGPESDAGPGGRPETAAPEVEPGAVPNGAGAVSTVEEGPEPQPDRPPEATEGREVKEEEEQPEDEGERESGPEVSFLRRRDDSIGPITVALSRKLKRALQDDQNDLLDRLRSRGNRPLEEILPPVAEHQEHFRRAGVELLGRAEHAGISFLREGREVDGGANGSGGGTGGSVALAGELATAITEPLRRRLERSLGDSADPDDASLIDNVGAAYREWKGPRIERVAGDHVVAAFSLGELGIAREGTTLRWIVDDGDERCPDCDDNALAGPLPRGERYPTGQAHPPAHSGCRCLLAPPPA